MNEYATYVVLIVATQTEESAVRKMYNWESVTFSDDMQIYYTALVEKEGRFHKIAYARQEEMEMTVAVT